MKFLNKIKVYKTEKVFELSVNFRFLSKKYKNVLNSIQTTQFSITYKGKLLIDLSISLVE